MEEALRQAAAAGERDEVPIGAVVVSWERAAALRGARAQWAEAVIATGRNTAAGSRRVTGHAELEALQAAAAATRSQYCLDARLYVTVEPCVMCFGAALAHRIAALVYAAPSPKFGAVSVCNLHAHARRLSHHMELARAAPAHVDAAAALMRAYFQAKRAANAAAAAPA